MTLTTIKPAGLSKPVDLADNEKIRLGTGNDIEIYHNSTDSFIDNNTGALRLCSDTHYIKDKDNADLFIKCLADGAVTLYYDDNAKLATTNTGVSVTGEIQTTGHIRIPDSMSLIAGTGNDLFIYHDGSNSYLEDTGTGDLIAKVAASNFRVRGAGNAEIAKFGDDGSVDLYYDGSKKFETYANGTKLYGHLIGLEAGKYVQWQGANSNAFAIGMTSGGDSPAGSDNHLQFHHWNNSSWDKVFYVHRDFINIPDNKKIGFGDGNDLQIYHNGTDSYIDNDHGYLYLNNETSGIRLISGSSWPNGSMAAFYADGSSELYWNNSKRFWTTDHGGYLMDDDTSVELRLLTAGETTRGYLYANSSNEVGLLDEGGNWAVRHHNDTITEFRIANGIKASITTHGGIAFGSDTAAANTLDDYEEGTWTPAISFGYNTYNQTYSHQQGQYTKIGNRVFCTCYVHFSNKGTATGIARLGGLPFTNANITVNYAVGAFWINQWNGGATVPTGYAQVNTSHVRIERQRCDNPSSSFGVSTCDNTNFNNNTDLMCSVTYRVA